ncbi:MAG: aldo/keto reductase [Nitrososphaeraceae archaeon]
MILREFGWTNLEVSVIGQGTWMIDGSTEMEIRAVQTLKKGLDLGMNHIDTAEMYGNGHVEELVAQAINERRKDVFLVSKVLPSNASYEGTITACKRSLKRLKTEWLDLFLLHWPSSFPVQETMRAMEKLVSDGYIKYIGVSNFDLNELKEAEKYLKDNRIACNQVLYHLGDRGVERTIIPYCEEKKIAVVGYSPFGHYNFPHRQSSSYKILEDIAKKYNRSPRQIILNFLTRHKYLFTIPKTTHIQRVIENANSVGWSLDYSDIELIDRVFPAPNHDMPLGMI